MHPSELWHGRGIGPTLARAALSPFALLYCLGWEAYLGMYRLGIKRAKHPHSPIFCVGNLVSGGSGKTPIVLHLVDVLRELGFNVAVSSSGYGSPRSQAAMIAPDGALDAREWGDEAALFRWMKPDLTLIVGRRRVLAAEICAQSYPDHILLMDDGFQHLPLGKDLSILLDPTEPMNAMCLPAGPYREPRWNRGRADLVLPGEFRVEESTRGFLTPEGTVVPSPSKAALLCAIGQPENVIRAMGAMGCGVRDRFLMSDHDPLTGGTLVQSLPSDIPTVVTAKDWVKLKNRSDIADRRFLILDHSATIEPAAEFKAWLKTKLDGIQEANIPR